MAGADCHARRHIAEAVSNLALVTIGNVLGGTVLVALVYWSVYLRNSD